MEVHGGTVGVHGDGGAVGGSLRGGGEVAWRSIGVTRAGITIGRGHGDGDPWVGAVGMADT